MMSQAVFVAVWASCLVAAVDLAPGDAPADAPADAPVDTPVVVQVCSRAADCTWAGDAAATCTADGTCLCAAHSGELCHVRTDGTPAKEVLRVNAVATMTRAVCDRGEMADLADLTKREVDSTQAQNTVVVTSCGSVTLVVDADLPAMTLAASIDALSAAMHSAVVAKESFTKVSATSPFEITVRAAAGETSGTVCTANAVNTVETYDGRCVVLECSVGFVATVEKRDAKDYGTCQAPTPVPSQSRDSDDELSGGAIAAIVLGCCGFVAVVAAGLIFFVLKPTQAKQKNLENEPTDATV